MVTEIQPTVDILKEIKLLDIFSPQELAQLLKTGVALSHEVHSNVVIEGELSWGLYIILEGLLGVFKTNAATGQTYDIGQLRAGNIFGEMSLIDENPRSATVKALTPCQLFFISKDSFTNFIDRNQKLKTDFYSNCVKILINRLRTLDDSFVISQYQLWATALKKDRKAS